MNLEMITLYLVKLEIISLQKASKPWLDVKVVELQDRVNLAVTVIYLSRKLVKSENTWYHRR